MLFASIGITPGRPRANLEVNAAGRVLLAVAASRSYRSAARDPRPPRRMTRRAPEVRGLPTVPGQEARPSQAVPIRLSHEFGRVVGPGTTLEHAFELENDSESPIHSLRAVVLTPCCSTIELQSDSILSGGAIKAKTTLKLGQQSEKRSVEFAIYSGPGVSPLWRLQLRAESLLDKEVSPVEPPSKFLHLTRLEPARKVGMARGDALPEGISQNCPGAGRGDRAGFGRFCERKKDLK